MNKLQDCIDQGLLIRGAWTGRDEHGRQLLCILAALSPEVLASHNPYDCPESLMPQWLAVIIPRLSDYASEEFFLPMAQRISDLSQRWHVLTEEDWKRLDLTAWRIAIETVLPLAGSATPNVERVLVLLRRAETGDMPSDEEFKKAGVAASEAAWVATEAAAAVWVVCAPDVERAAAWAAASEASGAEAADRMTTAILDAIEEAIALRETK